ncbi:MAG: AAA family ATPase [Bacteroidales bacterium]|nr:AAA family ATPase [Bacteroidales bacterium]
MKQKKFNALASFTFLSKSLEDTDIQILHCLDDRFVEVKRESDDEFRRRNVNVSAEDKKAILQELKRFSKFLQLDEIQTCVFIAYYTYQIDERDRYEKDILPGFFSASTLDLLPLKGVADQLLAKGYLRKNTLCSYGRRRMQISVDTGIEDSIINNKDFYMSEEKKVDRYRFCLFVDAEVENRGEGEISTDALFERVMELEEKHNDLTFVQNMKAKIKSVEKRTLFYIVCKDYLHNERTVIDKLLATVYFSASTRFRVASSIMNDSHELIQKDLVEKRPAEFFNRATLSLTRKGQELFLEEDFQLVQQKENDDKRLVAPEKINEKQLFFGKELNEQIHFLQKSLEDKQFTELQNRLQKKGMPSGVTAIFYGLPGTGKTESVMQIAKATGRKVMHVDISATKTCWYGESEKLVKRIFTDYAEKCKNEKLKPILLFNEADAVFGKRHKEVSHSSEQTDNTIQNILLEEMEKLDGIMIATTNLAGNLDEAFERRFLFKVKFEKPTIEAKRSIWKDKMPSLSDEACEKLALQFDFSGGEIDNIVRKFTMQEVLKDVTADYDSVVKLCNSEKLCGKERKKVGF